MNSIVPTLYKYVNIVMFRYCIVIFKLSHLFSTLSFEKDARYVCTLCLYPSNTLLKLDCSFDTLLTAQNTILQ